MAGVRGWLVGVDMGGHGFAGCGMGFVRRDGPSVGLWDEGGRPGGAAAGGAGGKDKAVGGGLSAGTAGRGDGVAGQGGGG